VPQISHTVSTDVAEQVDLLIACTKDAASGPIEMKFHHALSQIKLQAVKDATLDDKVVVVTGLTFKNLYSVGTASLGHETLPDTLWTPNGSAETEYVFTNLNGLKAATVLPNGVTPFDLNSENIFLLPQEAEVVMEINYTVAGESKSWASQPLGIAWKPGKSYTYAFRIGEDEVEFDYQDFLTSEAFTVPKTGYYYIEAWGGDGGNGGNSRTGNVINSKAGGNGGLGAHKAGLYYFTEGQLLQVQVGGAGGNGANADTDNIATSGAMGLATYFGSGGAGGNGKVNPGGNGGGGGGGGGAASGVLLGSTDLSNIILVAAGGGGGGGAGSSGIGGAGGIGDADGYKGGSGGSSGGTPGRAGMASGPNGNVGIDGTSNGVGGAGGGGGGYVGGGSVATASSSRGSPGGGGGLSYAGGTSYVEDGGELNITNPRMDNGGDGYVIITFVGEELP
jgi:hypothetical protein